MKKLQLEIHEIVIDMLKERHVRKLADSLELFTSQFWSGNKTAWVDSIDDMCKALKEQHGAKVKPRFSSPRRAVLRGLGLL